MKTTTKARRNALGRIFRWLSRKLEVAYWLGASETRQGANETTNGMMTFQPNDS